MSCHKPSFVLAGASVIIYLARKSGSSGERVLITFGVIRLFHLTLHLIGFTILRLHRRDSQLNWAFHLSLPKQVV